MLWWFCGNFYVCGDESSNIVVLVVVVCVMVCAVVVGVCGCIIVEDSLGVMVL